jgi:hypothetical protein
METKVHTCTKGHQELGRGAMGKCENGHVLEVLVRIHVYPELKVESNSRAEGAQGWVCDNRSLGDPVPNCREEI